MGLKKFMCLSWQYCFLPNEFIAILVIYFDAFYIFEDFSAAMLTDFLINSLSSFMACCQTGNGLLLFLSLANVPISLVLLHSAAAVLLCCCLLLNCSVPFP